ncbi:hypothetical protein ACFIJ5_12460 [Haloimpatiens sp. FM7330]
MNDYVNFCIIWCVISHKEDFNGYVFIKDSTKEESDLIWRGIIEYNSSKLTLKGQVPFMPVSRVMKDLDDNVIAGINCELNNVPIGHKRYYMKKIL